MLYIIRGLTLLMSPWPVSQIEGPLVLRRLLGLVGPIPIQIFWMLFFAIVGWLVMKRTTFGYYVRATGSNNAAALLSGIPVNRIKVIGFVLTALAAVFAGVLSSPISVRSPPRPAPASS